MCDTVESRFLEPLRETKIGSRNRGVRNIGGKTTDSETSPRETTFGSSYRGFWEIRISLYITFMEYQLPRGLPDQLAIFAYRGALQLSLAEMYGKLNLF